MSRAVLVGSSGGVWGRLVEEGLVLIARDKKKQPTDTMPCAPSLHIRWGPMEAASALPGPDPMLSSVSQSMPKILKRGAEEEVGEKKLLDTNGLLNECLSPALICCPGAPLIASFFLQIMTNL